MEAVAEAGSEGAEIDEPSQAPDEDGDEPEEGDGA
jgi:hypothetical protein